MTLIERAGLEAARRAFGDSFAQRLSYAYRDRVQPAMESVSYSLSPAGRRSRDALHDLRDRYRGQRAFIIGNGPSLNQMDLSPLRGELTFALNRGYLLFDRIGGPTTFLVAVNRYVVEQFGRELMGAGPTAFLSWRSRRSTSDLAGAIFVRRARLFSFSDDVARSGAWEGATVTYVALQLAFHLGFRQVVLIGVDHNFTTSGIPNALVTSAGGDPNHFDPAYFGAGVRWQLPDLETSEMAYRLAKAHYEAAGRSIVDATVGGRLDVFPKAAYTSLVT